MSDSTPTKLKMPDVSALDVIKAFWNAIVPHKWLFAVDVFGVLLGSLGQILIPLYYKRFFTMLQMATDRDATAPLLIHAAVLILAFGGVIWIGYRINTFAHNYFQAQAMAELRQSSFDYMMLHSYTFFSNNFTGSLTQRVNRYAKAFERLTDRFIWSIIPLGFNIVGVVIVLWLNQPIISMVVIAWVLVFLLSNYLVSRWKLKYDLKRAEIDSKVTGQLSDAITNSNTVQLFSGNSYENERFEDVTNEQAQASIVSWNLGAIVDSMQAGINFITEFLLFYIAIYFWRIGTIDLGMFILIQVYFLGLGGRLWEFSRIIRDVFEGMADAKEMIEITKLPHEIKDLPTAEPLKVHEGKIEFKDLTFSFNETRTILNDISLIIKPGEKVALIGPSGAGKSTFVRLLLRLYETTAGAIEIDGQDIKYVTQNSLRDSISLVPQDPVLFHRTLRENIGYGRRDATPHEIHEAAKLAHCDEFVKELTLGYETFVGERGIKLSGGERQRVAIARAILKNAPILILDEATSSLDSHSESLIQDALDVLMKGKTTIVIAHRLSTIRKMDRIIVVDEGKILEEGTHDELLAKETSLYKKLWDLQAGGFLQETETA
jgi:ATP-binding cassette subfamily B protein